EKVVLNLYIGSVFLYLLLSFLFYLPFHFKMKQLKTIENWQKTAPQTVVVDTSFRRESTSYSSRWLLIPLLATIATIAYTYVLYDQIPDQIPIHTSFLGKVTYDDKLIGNLLILPLSQLFMIFTFLIVNYVIKHSKQQISAENPARSKKL